MKHRTSLLSLAVVSALAVGSTAYAAQPGADTGAGAVPAAKAAAVARAQALIGALRKLAVKRADRVGTLMWNHYAHLEAYFAIPCMMLQIRGRCPESVGSSSPPMVASRHGSELEIEARPSRLWKE